MTFFPLATPSLPCLLVMLTSVNAAGPPIVDIGHRRELFVDDFLIDKRTGLELRLQTPIPREVVLIHDAPWEGTGCAYHTVFRDGDTVRMYYIAGQLTNEDGTQLGGRPLVACYAESRDGLRWVKPKLGLVEFDGNNQNNIILNGPGLDNFTSFKEARPDCPPAERYKAVSGGPGGLVAYQSADGVHWSRLGDKPIIIQGTFDTQNVAFWDPLRKQYWCYLRDFHDGIRDIRVATSADFRGWTLPVRVTYTDSPDEQLYTNQVQPYDRAPHLFLGFPTRYVERVRSPALAALPDWEHRQNRMKLAPRYGTALTDGQFMTSRDGRTFHRWDEAFIRPGPERKHNWLYGDGYQGLGLLETPAADADAPPELSLYVAEDSWKRAVRLRRYTLRVDGFVALHARRTPGELVTKPLGFAGKRLTLNFATSAAGRLRAELQDAAGQPLPGFTLAESDEIFGDALERKVTWKGQADVGSLTGRPVRLRLIMSEADLFSLRFSE